MHDVVQATRRIPGPSTAEPVVKECRKPRAPVLSALLTSTSGTSLPRWTRISNGDFASSETVSCAGAGAISMSRSVEGAVDHIHLLLARQPDEVHRIAGHANGETGILFGVVHCIHQRVAVQHVDVHVVPGR